MKAAIIGSRSLTVDDLREYLPRKKYGINAPLKRNISIIECADIVLAFWDGKSRGTKFVIERCYEIGKRIYVIAE